MSRGRLHARLLLVIDDSGSMSDNQVNLIANFPTFSDGIQAPLVDVTSHQVGVVATEFGERRAAP